MTPNNIQMPPQYSSLGSWGIVLIVIGIFSPRLVKWTTPYLNESWQQLVLAVIGDILTCGILFGIGLVIIGKLRNRKIDRARNLINNDIT